MKLLLGCRKIRIYDMKGTLHETMEKEKSTSPLNVDIVSTHDCTGCKNKLACLIDPECNRTFESK